MAEPATTVTLELWHFMTTDRAVLVNDTDSRTSATWLPLSLVAFKRTAEHRAIVTMPAWLAAQRGFVL